MVFIETPLFTQLVFEVLSEADYSALQRHLIAYPDAGDVIQQSGGLRKIRWSYEGKGKRGGVRVIYYYVVRATQIRFLLIYKKGRVDDLTPKQMVFLRRLNEEWH
jgi:mRNA-degrading endonuclease RelE of RelBE toxin-antitoxin system